jgi:hypothetical protein
MKNKKTNEMTKEEKSLLLFLETQAVDYWGKVDIRHMNEDDMNIAERWNKEGFIKFGRICFKDRKPAGGRNSTHWVILSEKAMNAAHDERKARAVRTWNKRDWKTTEEINENS